MNSNGTQANDVNETRRELSETLKILEIKEHIIESLRQQQTRTLGLLEQFVPETMSLVSEHYTLLKSLKDKNKEYESMENFYNEIWWNTMEKLEEKKHLIEQIQNEQIRTLECLKQNEQDMELIKDKNNEVLKSLKDTNREFESWKEESLDSWLHMMEERDILEAQVKELKKELEMIKKKQVRKTKDKSVQTQVLLQKIVSVTPCNFQIKNSDETNNDDDDDDPFSIKEDVGEGHQEREELGVGTKMYNLTNNLLVLLVLVLLLKPIFFFFFPTNHHNETIEIIDPEIDFGKDQIFYKECLQLAYSCLRRKNR